MGEGWRIICRRKAAEKSTGTTRHREIYEFPAESPVIVRCPSLPPVSPRLDLAISSREHRLREAAWPASSFAFSIFFSPFLPRYTCHRRGIFARAPNSSSPGIFVLCPNRFMFFLFGRLYVKIHSIKLEERGRNSDRESVRQERVSRDAMHEEKRWTNRERAATSLAKLSEGESRC